MGFSKRIRFSGGTDDQTRVIRKSGEVFKAVSMEREMVIDGNIRKFRLEDMIIGCRKRRNIRRSKLRFLNLFKRISYGDHIVESKFEVKRKRSVEMKINMKRGDH